MGNTTWITNAIQDAITTSVQDWLAQHPTIAWILTHPLWAVAIALLLTFLLWGLLRAIARFVERVWIAVFRLPLQLSGWILARLMAGLRGKSPSSTPAATAPQSAYPQVEHLLQRLDAVQKEQDALIEDIRALLRKSPEGSPPLNGWMLDNAGSAQLPVQGAPNGAAPRHRE